jgi:hypothetical protein
VTKGELNVARVADRRWRRSAWVFVLILLGLFSGVISESALAASKPWGELQTESIILEPPDEYLSNDRPTLEQLDWFFASETRTNFLEQIKFFDLTTEQRAAIQDARSWRSATNGYRFSPSPKLILGMSQLARGQIYLLLARHPENVYHHTPFILQMTALDAGLANSGLASETLSLLKRLLYKRGPSWCFSDMGVFRDLPRDEFKRLLKTLARVMTVVLKLHMTPESDVNALVRYWGKSGTERHVRTLLESLAKVPGGATIDVTHLLPPLARERLYRYPDPSQTNALTQQQCYWTALNFLNERSDDRYSKPKFVKEAVERDYVRVRGEAGFGDLVIITDGSDQLLHTSVYIADDMVFTKNGGFLLTPWVLMKIPEMVSAYSTAGPIKVMTIRQKQNSAHSPAGT